MVDRYVEKQVLSLFLACFGRWIDSKGLILKGILIERKWDDEGHFLCQIHVSWKVNISYAYKVYACDQFI